jgi:outer membrane autotransporter protein
MRIAGMKTGTALALPVVLWGYAGAAHAANTYGKDAAPNQIVAPEVTNAAAQQSTGLISERIAQAVSNATGGGGSFSPFSAPPITPPRSQTSESGGVKGLEGGIAAGNQAPRLALWANMSNTWLHGSQVGADFAGTIIDSLIGVDYMVTEKLLIGVVGGYEHAKLNSDFNSGSLRGTGLAIAPYAAYIFSDSLYVDATAGYTWIDYTTARANDTITGSTNGRRWFAAGNLTAVIPTPSDWVLMNTLGFLYVSENQDPFRESDGSDVGGVKVRLGQVRDTIRLGYRFTTGFGFIMPYGSARLEYDAVKSPDTYIDSAGTLAYGSKFGTTFGLGLNMGIGDNTIISLEANSTQFRENLEAYSLVANIRYKF